MTALLLLHLLAAVLAPGAGAVVGPSGVPRARAGPGDGVRVADDPGEHGPRRGRAGGGAVHESVPWIPVLHLTVAFRLDALAMIMTLVVAGIGTLVLLYCARYFQPGDAGAWAASPGSSIGVRRRDARPGPGRQPARCSTSSGS